MAFQWEVEPDLVFEELVENYSQTVFASGRRVAESRAADMERWAKDNAPWTDRTGDARRELHATVGESPGVLADVTLAHGVDYGIWLEIANQGRYAIIAPAIDHWGPVFMRDVQRIINLGLAAR